MMRTRSPIAYRVNVTSKVRNKIPASACSMKGTGTASCKQPEIQNRYRYKNTKEYENLTKFKHLYNHTIAKNIMIIESQENHILRYKNGKLLRFLFLIEFKGCFCINLKNN